MNPTTEASPAQRSVAEPAGQGDDAVVRQRLMAVAGGDRRALEALYHGFHAPLSRFISRHTGRRELIDDIINETFWIVWRKAGVFRGESRVSTWIIGIAYRCMLKALREHPVVRVAASVGDDAIDAVEVDDSEADQRELRDWLRRGMALLPAEQRMTLELAYYLGQSCEEIAEVMDCAVGTVKARLFHARVRLRNSLPSLGGEMARAGTAGERSR